MISTLNGCYHSPIKVIPQNWRTTKPSLKQPLRVYYNFHDPSWMHLKKCKQGKLVRILGMNRYLTLEGRQAASIVGCGYYIAEEQPEELLRVVLPFLEGINER